MYTYESFVAPISAPDFMDRWVDSGMKAEFPYIKPTSELAGLGLGIKEDAERLYTQIHDGNDHIKNDDRELASQYEFAAQQVHIFRRISQEVWVGLRTFGVTPTTGRTTYLDLIHTACTQEQVRARTHEYLKESKRNDLVQLAGSIGLILFEEDVHFQPPKA